MQLSHDYFDFPQARQQPFRREALREAREAHHWVLATYIGPPHVVNNEAVNGLSAAHAQAVNNRAMNGLSVAGAQEARGTPEVVGGIGITEGR